ncbi:hypothetical protein WME76_18165 [Sorangium sp. So ce119]|uniref:hypothetical protein n=1 Tax=Sorangium sp. So ce119 TaxID=3133279 RepID=UPI003F5E3C5A
MTALLVPSLALLLGACTTDAPPEPEDAGARPVATARTAEEARALAAANPVEVEEEHARGPAHALRPARSGALFDSATRAFEWGWSVALVEVREAAPEQARRVNGAGRFAAGAAIEESSAEVALVEGVTGAGGAALPARFRAILRARTSEIDAEGRVANVVEGQRDGRPALRPAKGDKVLLFVVPDRERPGAYRSIGAFGVDREGRVVDPVLGLSAASPVTAVLAEAARGRDEVDARRARAAAGEE